MVSLKKDIVDIGFLESKWRQSEFSRPRQSDIWLIVQNINLSRYIVGEPKDFPEEEDAADFEKGSDFLITDQSTPISRNSFHLAASPRIRHDVGSL